MRNLNTNLMPLNNTTRRTPTLKKKPHHMRILPRPHQPQPPIRPKHPLNNTITRNPLRQLLKNISPLLPRLQPLTSKHRITTPQPIQRSLQRLKRTPPTTSRNRRPHRPSNRLPPTQSRNKSRPLNTRHTKPTTTTTNPRQTHHPQKTTHHPHPQHAHTIPKNHHKPKPTNTHREKGR